LIVDHLISGITQTVLVILLCGLVYGAKRLLGRKTSSETSFPRFVGLHKKGFKIDNKFLLVLCAMMLLGVSTTFVQFFFMRDAMDLLKSDSSPYYKILKTGFGLQSLVAGFIYCFMTSGFSEEVLFRGLIAKRLISLLGFLWGNAIQATIFWLLHFLLVWWITKEWFSPLQFMTLVTTIFMGLILCYWNEKQSNGSIVASWIFHASANLSTFLTLAVLFT
jgi:uncharacterized protein